MLRVGVLVLEETRLASQREAFYLVCWFWTATRLAARGFLPWDSRGKLFERPLRLFEKWFVFMGAGR